MSPDADDLLENDKQKVKKYVRNYRQGGSWKDNINPPQVLEQVCWALAITSILGMVVSMPWVGPGKPIPGEAWLGIPLALFIMFGLAGGTIRMARRGFSDADRTVSNKFERGR